MTAKGLTMKEQINVQGLIKDQKGQLFALLLIKRFIRNKHTDRPIVLCVSTDAQALVEYAHEFHEAIDNAIAAYNIKQGEFEQSMGLSIQDYTENRYKAYAEGTSSLRGLYHKLMGGLIEQCEHVGSFLDYQNQMVVVPVGLTGVMDNDTLTLID